MTFIYAYLQIYAIPHQITTHVFRYLDRNELFLLPYLTFSYNASSLQQIWLSNNPQLQCYSPAPAGVNVHVEAHVGRCSSPRVVSRIVMRVCMYKHAACE